MARKRKSDEAQAQSPPDSSQNSEGTRFTRSRAAAVTNQSNALATNEIPDSEEETSDGSPNKRSNLTFPSRVNGRLSARRTVTRGARQNSQASYVPVNTRSTGALSSDPAIIDADLATRFAKEISDLSVTPDSGKAIELPIDNSFICDAEAKARRPRINYAGLLKRGLTAIANAAREEEMADKHPIIPSFARKKYLRLAVSVLASIPGPVLKHLVGGNLPLAIKGGEDPELNDIYRTGTGEGEDLSDISPWMERSRSPNSPGCYVQYHVDKEGNAPSPSQYLKIVPLLRNYVSGDSSPENLKAALEMENAFGRDNQLSSLDDLKAGQYKYLRGMTNRVETILTFCKALELRFEGLSEEELATPLKEPLNHPGYSKGVTRRLETHKERETSWFFHFILAAFKVKFGEVFFMDGYPVCFCVSEDEVRVAKALIVVITNSWFWTGGGFSIVSGGIQTTSSRFPGQKEAIRTSIWRDCAAWRENNSVPWRRNLEKEQSRLKDQAEGRDRGQESTPIRMEVEANEKKVRLLTQELDDLRKDNTRSEKALLNQAREWKQLLANLKAQGSEEDKELLQIMEA